MLQQLQNRTVANRTLGDTQVCTVPTTDGIKRSQEAAYTSDERRDAAYVYCAEIRSGTRDQIICKLQ